MSQSVNLSLGPRWTGSHATRSPHKTSNASAMGLMLGMIMPPPPPLISGFHPPPPSPSPSLSPFFLSVCLSLSIYLFLSSGGCCRIGWQYCVGGDYVWSADSDLTFSMLSLRLKPTLMHWPPPMLPLNVTFFSSSSSPSCHFVNVSYMFRREGTFWPQVIAVAPVAFHGSFVVFSVCAWVCPGAQF